MIYRIAGVQLRTRLLLNVGGLQMYSANFARLHLGDIRDRLLLADADDHVPLLMPRIDMGMGGFQFVKGVASIDD